MNGRNRYSQGVAWIKVILPLLALSLLSTLFLFSRMPDPEQAIPFSEVDIEELVREQRLGSPRFAGTLDNGRQFEFLADVASPVAGQLSLVHAEGIQTRIDLSETDFIMIHAEYGLFDLTEQRASLDNDVMITSSHGYTLSTQELSIGLADFWVTSPTETIAEGPNTQITAGAMEIRPANEAHVVIFNGGVRVLYSAGE
ncbi:MAG: lipopolysaccharide export system protein LptC [Paracoccaceae bacterium]|jgi:lipopolysaccharide export system protein LptC